MSIGRDRDGPDQGNAPYGFWMDEDCNTVVSKHISLLSVHLAIDHFLFQAYAICELVNI